METAMTPTVSEMRAPSITRLATSRPGWPRPTQTVAPRGCNAVRGAVLTGSRGLSHGAASATSDSAARMTSPIAAPRWRASRRGRLTSTAPSPKADARVGVCVGDVDHHVDHHVDGGHEESGALHELEVLGQDAADDERAEPAPAA